MSNTPKVSILVSIYNNEIYLNECIDSIINQTLKDIEIILLDDGSTDNSPQICDEYAKKDKRVKVIHKPNSGYGATMNVGIDNSTGEYIGIVESDDYVELDMFETLYNTAKQDGQSIDFIKSNYNVFYGDKNKRMFKKNNKEVYNINDYNKTIHLIEHPDMLAYDPHEIWSSIYRRQYIIDNNIRFNETPGASYQDTGFSIQNYLLSKTFYAINKAFYNLRRDNPNSSVYNKKKVFVICDEYKFIENIARKYNFSQSIYNAILYKKYNGYIWNMNRIADEFKLPFLEKFAEEFKNVKDEELEFFSEDEKYILSTILTNPQEYMKYITISETSIFLFSIINILKIKHKLNVFRYYILYIPLFKIKEKSNKKKYYLFGLPIWKVKTKNNKKKYYLFNFLPILTIKRK